MEEQVIQGRPWRPLSSPWLRLQTLSTLMFCRREQQIQALQQRASEAEEKFQGIKGKSDEFTKNKTSNVAKRWKTIKWKDLWEEQQNGSDQRSTDR